MRWLLAPRVTRWRSIKHYRATARTCHHCHHTLRLSQVRRPRLLSTHQAPSRSPRPTSFQIRRFSTFSREERIAKLGWGRLAATNSLADRAEVQAIRLHTIQNRPSMTVVMRPVLAPKTTRLAHRAAALPSL